MLVQLYSHWFSHLDLNVDRPAPFQYNLNAPSTYASPTDQEVNELIREDLFNYILSRLRCPPELPTKLEFYHRHCLQISTEGFIVPLGYTQLHLPHALWISLDQFMVSSHRLRIESRRAKGVRQEGHICTLCDLRGVRSKEHFAFKCLIYYVIRGKYHYLFCDDLTPSHSFFTVLINSALQLSSMR